MGQAERATISEGEFHELYCVSIHTVPIQERKYVELEDEIKAEMGRRAAERDKLVAEAKAAGQLKAGLPNQFRIFLLF